MGNSVEFSYQELAKATNNFNASCKIGAGGFGEVFFAELRGEVISTCISNLLNILLNDASFLRFMHSLCYFLVLVYFNLSSSEVLNNWSTKCMLFESYFDFRKQQSRRWICKPQGSLWLS